MFKRTQKQHLFGFWFAAALIAELAIAPNMTVMRVMVQDIDPMMFNSLRSALVVAVTLPFILFAIRKFTRINLVYTLAAGFCMAVATISIVFALSMSPASYVVVLGLVQPVILVLMTRWFMREKISFRTSTGVVLAAVGAVVAVTFPLALHGDTSLDFYPLATALIAASCVFFPLGMVFFRKANEAGLPLPAMQGLASLVILIISLIGLLTFGTVTPINEISTGTWIGALYSGIIVVLLARMVLVASYEKIGSGPIAILTYLGSIVAILIPVLVLGETLSVWVLAGGLLILLGVYFSDQHKSRRHFHALRHH